MHIVADRQPIPSHDVAECPTLVSAERGVYAIGVATRVRFLQGAGYYAFDKRTPIEVGGFELVYVGATGGRLCDRVRAHLTGSSRGSSWRQSLGALLATELNLDPETFGRGPNFGFGQSESRLTDWLLENTAVLATPHPEPFRVEAELLATEVFPLNLSGRRRHRFSRYVSSLKQVYACQPPSGTTPRTFTLRSVERRPHV